MDFARANFIQYTYAVKLLTKVWPPYSGSATISEFPRVHYNNLTEDKQLMDRDQMSSGRDKDI